MAETLRELTSEFRDIQQEIEILSELELETENAEKALASLKSRILRKTEAIDGIITNFDIANNKIETYVDILKKEIENAKARKTSLLKSKTRLLNYLAEVGLVAKDKPLRTTIHTYFLQTTNGELKIDDPSLLPEEYIKTKIEKVIDKASLRSDVLANKVFIEGVSIPKNTRVSRR